MSKDSPKPTMKHIDAAGNYVDEGDAQAAYVVNMDDPDALNFIESKSAGAAPQASVSFEKLLDGVDKRAVKSLKDAGYDSAEKIAAAGDDELLDLAYVSESILTKIRQKTDL